MEYDWSPAVQRAYILALERARSRHATSISISDWLLALIEDEEGKPAKLLVELGVGIELLREQVQKIDFEEPAPYEQKLLKTARELAILLRGETDVTSEFVLLALLEANEKVSLQLKTLGLDPAVLRSRLHDPTRIVSENSFSSEPKEIPNTSKERVSVGHEVTQILDVNANRAAESCRILDDYCRFLLRDATLTQLIKQLRHDLANALQNLPARKLLTARNTIADPGTGLQTSDEYVRNSSTEVARINLKRLQESLRSLEEYGKTLSTAFAAEVERLRYQSYSLERAILLGTTSRQRLEQTKLCLLFSYSQCQLPVERFVKEAMAGGVTMLQLREKAIEDRVLLRRAEELRRWTAEQRVLLIINDRPDIARLVGADGVHLGQDDLPVGQARRLLAEDALIGVSTHSMSQLQAAILEGADYLGAGPTFPSTTKHFSSFAGLSFIQEASTATSLPVFPLGGINRLNIHEVVQAGARRVAVSAVITASESPETVARTLLNALP